MFVQHQIVRSGPCLRCGALAGAGTQQDPINIPRVLQNKVYHTYVDLLGHQPLLLSVDLCLG